MARSAKAEPVEKFRFQVRFFSLKANGPSPGVGNIAQVITGTDSGVPEFDNPFKTHLSNNDQIAAGFSQITPPKANVNVIEYRENIHMNRTTKQPGLVSYEPVVLRKGVTTSKGLYNWYKEVHNDVFDLNSANQVLAGIGVVPVHDPRFRREAIISVLDREGNAVKHWFCVNCFPISYQGSDQLDAKAEDKAVEELSFTYEAFIELVGGDLKAAFQDAQQEANQAVADALNAALIGASTGALAGLF